MKKKLILLLPALIAISSCQSGKTETPFLEASPSSFDNVSSEGGKLTINVKSNVAWEAKCGDTQIKISPASGEGNVGVTVDVPKNEATTSKNYTLSFTSAKISQPIEVKIQQKETDFKLSVGGFQSIWGDEGGECTFTLNSNYAWKIEVDPPNSSFSFNPSTGTGGEVAQVTMTVSKNTKAEDWNGTVFVKTTNKQDPDSKKFAVYQSGKFDSGNKTTPFDDGGTIPGEWK